MKCNKIKWLSLGAVLAAVIAVLVLLPANKALAATEGDWEYEVLEDGTVEITAYNGTDTEVTVPGEIEGKKVVSMVATFACNHEITKVVISEGIERIESCAFLQCYELGQVEIPDSVTYIGDDAFNNCISLIDIEIPDGVTYIGDNAFLRCYELRQVEIPDSVTEIGSYAFYGCYNLEKVTGGNALEYISNSAFSGTKWLRELSLVKKGARWGREFGKFFLESMNAYDFQDELSYDEATDRYYAVLPDDTAIFYSGRYDLSPVDGHTITMINSDAFNIWSERIGRYRPSIDADTLILADTIEYVGNSAFYNNNRYTKLVCSSSLIEIGAYAFTGATADAGSVGFGEGNLASVELNDGLQVIGYGAFFSQPIKEITIPASVTKIGDEAIGYYALDSSAYEPGVIIKDEKYADVTIYGYKGTAAETYAVENGFTFVALDDSEEPTDGDSEEPTDGDDEKPTTGDPETPDTDDISVTVEANGEFLPRIDMSKADILSAISKYLTKEQLAAVENKTAELAITLEITDINGTVSEEDVQLIAKAIESLSGDSGYKVLNYLDIKLGITIDGEKVAVAETDGTITVSVAVDGASGGTYKIVRIHDGKAEVLDAQPDKDGKRLTFKTDKFSTYAIIHSDEASVETPAGDDVPSGERDAKAAGIVIAALVLAAAGIIVCNIEDSRRNKFSKAE